MAATTAVDDGATIEPRPPPSATSTAEAKALPLLLAPDVALQLYGFLPVADLLALSATSRDARDHVKDPQHWRDLVHRQQQGNSDAVRDVKWDGKEGSVPDDDYRAAFVRTAEAALQWRRGRPVAVRERRLAMGEGKERLQSMALWRPRGLLLVAAGDELGVFDMARGREEEEGDGDCPPAMPTARLLAHEGSKVTVVQATPLGPVTAGMDGRVVLLDWETLGVREALNHHTSAVWGLDTELVGSGGGGAPIVAASCFRRITLSDMRQPPHHHPAVSYQGHATWVRTLHLEMDRHLLVSGSADASCKTWDLRAPGQMQAKLVHPNHFEEVRAVQCRGDRVYTACYDGMVREFDLGTGRLRRAVADHRPYAVEALQLGPDPTARLVSVDWSGVVACLPSTGAARGAVDVETLVYGRDGPATDSISTSTSTSVWGKEGAAAHSHDAGPSAISSSSSSSYRLSPGTDPSSGRLRYRRLAPREEAAEVEEAHMTSSVGCLVHDDDCLLLGTADGRLVSMLFRSGL